MQAAAVNGIHIHYKIAGREDGPTIVFSNSLGTDFRIWHDVAARLAGRFRMIFYDKRGHGLSDATPSPYRIEEHVSDLSGLLDHLKVDEAVVCGLSVGGQIAQGLAAAEADRVQALILCDTAHKIGTADAWNDRIKAVEGGGIASIAEAILERWFTEEFRKVDEASFAIYRNMLIRTPVAGYAGTCAALRDADLTESTKKLDMPVLVVCGDQDGATPPDLVRSMAALIDGAHFELIEGAGHLPCIEKPAALTAAMLTFLEENNLAD